MTLSSIRTGQYPQRDPSRTPFGAISTGRLPVEREEESKGQPPRLMAYCKTGSTAKTIQAYSRYLAKLLDIHLDDSQIVAQENPTCEDLIKRAGLGADLIIVEKLNQSFVSKLLLGSPECRAATHLKASMLFARQPRWPLKRVLLVTRGQDRDTPAVDWVVRLTRPSGAAITVLALQPYMSAIQCQALYGQGLTTWLTTYTPLGQQLRRIVDHVVHGEIDSRLRLRFRQGAPDWQVRCEAEEGNYDLIIVAADSASRWERRLPGEVVSPLLRWANRPVLIAKPPTTNNSRIANQVI